MQIDYIIITTLPITLLLFQSGFSKPFCFCFRFSSARLDVRRADLLAQHVFDYMVFIPARGWFLRFNAFGIYRKTSSCVVHTILRLEEAREQRMSILH